MSSPAGLPGLPGPCSGGASPSGCSARVPSKRGPRNQPRRRHDAGAICNRRTIVAEITVEDPALAQRRTLRRHRSFATALLVAMGLIYVGATWLGETGFWIDLLRAGTEAALVGGLADWFAVTALVRHPPGLPIPHTAVIPRNKDRIGQGLGSFIERHFLQPKLVPARQRASGLRGRRSAVEGKSVSVRICIRGGCCLKKKKERL